MNFLIVCNKATLIELVLFVCSLGNWIQVENFPVSDFFSFAFLFFVCI